MSYSVIPEIDTTNIVLNNVNLYSVFNVTLRDPNQITRMHSSRMRTARADCVVDGPGWYALGKWRLVPGGYNPPMDRHL